MNSLAPGSRIGSYRIVRTLSEAGHFSLVYCAQSRDGGEIALKENFPVGAAYRSRDGATLRIRDRDVFAWALARFEREAEFLCRHRHANLVRVLEPPIRQNGTSYMAMEYLTAGSLRRRIEQGGAQGEAQVRAWLDPVLAALQSIESVGTSHLDLSPDNVMFRGTGEPVLVDFGSARIGGMAPMQRTRMITNSGYSAPEKLTRTSRDLDARADVYSVAALVNFAMTGREPSPAQDRMVGGSALPARLATRRQGGPAFLAAIDKGFAIAIADRHRDAAAFRRALADSENHRRPEAAEEPTDAPPYDDEDGRRRRAGIFVLIFALLCILSLISLLI